MLLLGIVLGSEMKLDKYCGTQESEQEVYLVPTIRKRRGHGSTSFFVWLTLAKPEYQLVNLRKMICLMRD